MKPLAELASTLENRPTARNARRATTVAAPNVSAEQFQRLAEFRFQLRRFLHFSYRAAEQAGLRPQQYQLLQCVCGMPAELDPTIANVAARMLLKHNSAVELVDRTIEQGFLRRCSDPTDHRRILLRLTPLGGRTLESLAEYHLEELDHAGPELIRALRRVLSTKAEMNSGSIRLASERRRNESDG
jgi:DNA-binding MarR family transcriptional regulator